MNQTPIIQQRYPGAVAVFFTAHWGIDARDWDLIREPGRAHHPLAGYYKSDETAVLRQQLQWMRRAGIDVIVYNAFSTGKRTLMDLPKDTTLPLLLEELAHQEFESRKLQLCFSLEAHLSNPTVDQYDFALGYIQERVGKHDFYFRYHGKPLVLAILNGENRAINDVEWRNAWFDLRRLRAFYTDGWSYAQHYPQLRRKDWMPASPGFTPLLEPAPVAPRANQASAPDHEEIWRNTPKAEREDGMYYRKQLLWAKQANPEIIFVSGWNDWRHGLQIEPAVEYGGLYLDLTSEILGRWEETALYREAVTGMKKIVPRDARP